MAGLDLAAFYQVTRKSDDKPTLTLVNLSKYLVSNLE